jgi:hypothetical protein
MRRRELLSALAVPLLHADAPNYSRLVYPGKDGRLVYTPDELGNCIPDFSRCGYMAGGVPLPDVPVRLEISPAPGDATERVQAAIDRVSSLPLDARGFRGALLLRKGRYPISGSLRVSASGVVLRGEGNGPDDTILEGAGKGQRAIVVVKGADYGRVADSGVPIAGDYLPVGSVSLRVRDAARFKRGDAVIVRRVGNDAWIRELKMDHLPPRADGGPVHPWSPFDLDFERVVTAVDGDTITLDAPITCAVETKWGGGVVLEFRDQRIRNVGVENLRGVSAFNRQVTALYGREKEKYQSDEDHAWSFVSIDNACDAWVRRITALHFGYACVEVRRARQVTVEDCDCREMVSVITGSRRYPFVLGGQLTVVQRCKADTARHDFAVQARACGPNVFLHCQAGRSFATSEPHHRWSVGGLYDNVKANIAIQDRQNMGSGHGWAGANYVAWNCEGSLVCQKPPTAQNWAIGEVGKRERGAFTPRPDGWWESQGRHVSPESLYLAQIKDRLG